MLAPLAGMLAGVVITGCRPQLVLHEQDLELRQEYNRMVEVVNDHEQRLRTLEAQGVPDGR